MPSTARNSKMPMFWPNHVEGRNGTQSLLSSANIIAGAYGAGFSIRINLVGQIFLSELFALAGLIFTRPVRLISQYPALRSAICGYLILFMALIFSDIYNESSPSDYLRGWASVAFAIVNLLFIASLLDRSRNALLAYLFCSACGAAIFGVSPIGVDEGSNFFKIRIAPVVFPAILCLSCILAMRSRRWAAALLFAGAAGFISMDARSGGGVLFTSGLVLVAKIKRIKISVGQLLIAATLVAAVTYAGYVVYVDYALSNAVKGGNSAHQLGRMTNPYNPIELLYYGRTEFFVGLRAINDHPWLGYGSWALDKYGTYSAMMAQAKEFKFNYYSEWIPAHSVLLTSWLWAGLGGLLGILVVFLSAVRRAIDAFSLNTYLEPAIYALSIDMVWNFFFSPFGHIRVSLPLVIALLSVLPARRRSGGRRVKGAESGAPQGWSSHKR